MTMQLMLRDLRRRLLLSVLHRMSDRRRRITAWRLLLELDVQSIAFRRDGLIWNLRPDLDIGLLMFVDGGFQASQMQALLGWMRRAGVFSGSRDVFVDAGANIGTTCIPIVRETGCRALAIEPVEENFRYLARNVEANGMNGRIRLAKQAIARKPGTVKMCLTAGSHGGNFVAREGLTEIPEHVISGYEEIGADALTSIIESAGYGMDEIAMVWADVQGCEMEVVESGSRLWAQGVPLWAEVEPHSLRRQEAYDVLPDALAAHFGSFIDSRDLRQHGERAAPRPIGEFAGLMQQITPEESNTDVLLLPRGF